MKDTFVASFCHKGILGGALYLKSDGFLTKIIGALGMHMSHAVLW